MVMVAISIAPVGEGVSVSSHVASALRVLDQHPELNYELGPMFTTIEGEYDSVMGAIREMQEVLFSAGVERVATVIKIDERRDKPLTMEGKMAAVRSKLS